MQRDIDNCLDNWLSLSCSYFGFFSLSDFGIHSNFNKNIEYDEQNSKLSLPIIFTTQPIFLKSTWQFLASCPKPKCTLRYSYSTIRLLILNEKGTKIKTYFLSQLYTTISLSDFNYVFRMKIPKCNICSIHCY